MANIFIITLTDALQFSQLKINMKERRETFYKINSH